MESSPSAEVAQELASWGRRLVAMLVDGVSFVGSVVFLRRIRSPEPPIEAEEGTTRERLLAGLSFVLRDPIMRPTLLSVAVINLFTFASNALFILYATTTLGVSPGLLGLALGTGAVGAVIGAIIASRVGRRIGLGLRATTSGGKRDRGEQQDLLHAAHCSSGPRRRARAGARSHLVR